MKFVVFQSRKNRKWYFHLRARNGRTTAPSQGYGRKQSCLRTIHSIIDGIAAGRCALQILPGLR